MIAGETAPFAKTSEYPIATRRAASVAPSFSLVDYFFLS
jgi:hypothetical protein